MQIEVITHTDFDMDGREYACSWDVLRNGEKVVYGLSCLSDADAFVSVLEELADAQAEIARLRGALQSARTRLVDEILGADSQDRRVIGGIEDAITGALK